MLDSVSWLHPSPCAWRHANVLSSGGILLDEGMLCLLTRCLVGVLADLKPVATDERQEEPDHHGCLPISRPE